MYVADIPDGIMTGKKVEMEVKERIHWTAVSDHCGGKKKHSKSD